MKVRNIAEINAMLNTNHVIAGSEIYLNSYNGTTSRVQVGFQGREELGVPLSYFVHEHSLVPPYTAGSSTYL